jgi:hypothetical protein
LTCKLSNFQQVARASPEHLQDDANFVLRLNPLASADGQGCMVSQDTFF